MALWGQFLRGDRTLYQPHAALFVGRFSAARGEREPLAAFPLHKLDWHTKLDEICPNGRRVGREDVALGAGALAGSRSA